MTKLAKVKQQLDKIGIEYRVVEDGCDLLDLQKKGPNKTKRDLLPVLQTLDRCESVVIVIPQLQHIVVAVHATDIREADCSCAAWRDYRFLRAEELIRYLQDDDAECVA